MKLKHAKVSAALVTCLALVTACGGESGTSDGGGDGKLSGQQLVFVNYGGDSLAAAKAGWLEPFTKKTGVKFATDSPTNSAKIKTMVDSGSTTWDVVDSDIATGSMGCGTLFEKRPADFDTSGVDPQYVTDDCLVPILRQSIALVYNKKLFGDAPPTSVEDFMDLDTFPGKRIVYSGYVGGAVEPLLIADGVEPDKMYPIDWTRAEGVFDKLGKNAVLQPELAQQQASLESGDFSMCLCYVARAALAAENGADVEVVWDKIYSGWDGAYAVKGSKSPEAQWEFMQFLATPEGQNPYYEHLPYSPTTVGEAPATKPTYERFMPALNQDKIKVNYYWDVPYWNTNAEAAVEEWTRITTG